MKLVLSIGLILLINVVALCQSGQLLAEHQAFRDELLNTYRKLKATPEEHAHLNKLKSFPFFPFVSAFLVPALLDPPSSGFSQMGTSHGHFALSRRYGYLSFAVSGRSFRMPVYQAKTAADSGSNELFFPFTDGTNGETTYGGGRYIDLHTPKGTELILDFNRSYNPYCAYSQKYSCEIPPEENHFPVRIEAGLTY